MTRAAKEVAYFLNNRPLCFLSMAFSLRDIFLGFGLAFNRPDLSRTIMHENLDQLGGAWVYGLVLMLVGVYVAVTAVKERTRWTQFGLRFQSFFWLFACFSYFLNGNYLLGLIWLCSGSIPAGYIAFYYKNHMIWDEPKRIWRQRHGLVDSHS